MSRGLALFVRRDGLGYAYALVRLSTAREEFAASKAPGPSDRYPGEMTAMEWELICQSIISYLEILKSDGLSVSKKMQRFTTADSIN